MTAEDVVAPRAEAGATIGVIGTGNMGSALVRGWSRALPPGGRLLVWDKIPSALQRLAECQGVVVAHSLATAAGAARRPSPRGHGPS